MVELKNQVKIKILNSKVVSSPFTKGYCKKYYLELNYNNKSYRFNFHDSIYNYQHNKKLNKLDTIYAVLMDSNSIEYTKDFSDFCNEFGYKTYTETFFPYYRIVENQEAKKIYNACIKTYEALHDIFSSDELEKLRNEFQDY